MVAVSSFPLEASSFRFSFLSRLLTAASRFGVFSWRLSRTLISELRECKSCLAARAASGLSNSRMQNLSSIKQILISNNGCIVQMSYLSRESRGLTWHSWIEEFVRRWSWGVSAGSRPAAAVSVSDKVRTGSTLFWWSFRPSQGQLRQLRASFLWRILNPPPPLIV